MTDNTNQRKPVSRALRNAVLELNFHLEHRAPKHFMDALDRGDTELLDEQLDYLAYLCLRVRHMHSMRNLNS